VIKGKKREGTFSVTEKVAGWGEGGVGISISAFVNKGHD